MKNIISESGLVNVRGLKVAVDYTNTIIVESEKPKTKAKYSWFGVPISTKKHQLINSKEVEATLKNTSNHSINIMLWVIADSGWNSVGNSVEIQQNETGTISCDIRAVFPDGTPKLDPSRISEIRIMLMKPTLNTTFSIEQLIAKGVTSNFKVNKDRLIVPNLEFSNPKAGKRVVYKFNENSNLYSVLYLPKNWNPNKKYPVVVEFPGNIFYTEECFSTGRPEQCVIGYGMTIGEDAIWLSMPFVDYEKDEIAESGWGNPNHTADYTVKVVKDIIKKFGGDKNNLVLTGFSRGAIACGFIGLRNDTIASLWKGIHACQHYDGDGWGGAKMNEAIERLKKFKGESFFQTDNFDEEPKNMLSNASVKTTFVNSGLNAHACDMFLDNRPSTLELRKWFKHLTSN